MSKRKKIQISSILVATILVLGGTTVCGYLLAGRYRMALEYSYRRALGDLETSISAMETALTKARYANTAPQQNSLAAQLLQETSAAKSALAVLPVKDGMLDRVSRFVAQVGDYAMTLSRKISAGTAISESEYETLASLGQYASELKTETVKAVQYFGDGQKIGDAEKLLDNLTEEKPSALGDAFESTAEQLADFPTLLYDGPFSDHVGQETPLFLTGKAEVSAENARRAAASLAGLPTEALTQESDSTGGLPLYRFASDGVQISITKAGGVPLSLLRSRKVEKAVLTEKEALEKANAFLSAQGIKGMQENYYITGNQICTFHFVYSDGEVLYYPDLIKISVALDNGEILKYEATGYVMNHHSRDAFPASLSIDEAERKVSPHLEVQTRKTAVVPTPAGGEVCCYEFLCKGFAGEQVLVYINTETGLEENILILLQSDEGTLVK
ncbi:PepSY1/2 domain-containing protein [Yeguia hominis]|uniref:Germination protein YpeB n=1 Tax=Yeguia hominis TaxID=2763662 RepID=A0A926D9E8_9FIRM|nr:PepSY1/2 domain-containing protein [Yeguia hominis]MBC8534121.1 germination protein YpeB [Yeguia hominis]